MIKAYYLFSNWIFIWYILFHLNIVDKPPIFFGIFSFIFFVSIIGCTNISKEIYYFISFIHLVVAVDLYLIYKKNKELYDLKTELKVFLIYNVVLLLCNKTCDEIYFKLVPEKYEKYPNMSVYQFLKTAKIY